MGTFVCRSILPGKGNVYPSACPSKLSRRLLSPPRLCTNPAIKFIGLGGILLQCSGHQSSLQPLCSRDGARERWLWYLQVQVGAAGLPALCWRSPRSTLAPNRAGCAARLGERLRLVCPPGCNLPGRERATLPARCCGLGMGQAEHLQLLPSSPWDVRDAPTAKED